MFIVGVAMPFSYGKRWDAGATWAATFRHALKRSFLLLLFGWALYCIGPGRLTFELWNVLAQLAFTCLVAFLMMRRSAPAQIAFSIGLLALTVAGYALDPVTPIVKRIATSTFVLAGGGWCLLVLAFAYWLIDIVKVRRGWKFLAIVGMNPLFIYLFTETGGAGWFRGIARPFTEGIFGGLGDQAGAFATSLAVWAMLWGLCYALYRRRIFVRI